MPQAASKRPKRPAYHPPLVISVHGIRTHGEWQKLFASALSGSPVRTEPFDYGRYGLFRFLTPPFNNRLVDKFYNWYGTVIKACPGVDLDRYDKRPSAVAHSLGSWIVGNAMLKYEDIRFDKLILAGSILPTDFDWATLFSRDQVARVRNECGQKDPWPGWAGRLVARAGTGGSKGFEWLGTAVENVRCEWFGHSDALMRQHIERLWLPLLLQPPSPLALLHGRDIQGREEFSKILDYAVDIIDAKAFGDVPHYPEIELPRGLALSWVEINPDIYTFLIDRQTSEPAGYINAMPVESSLYEEIRAGKLDNTVPPSGIVPFLGSRTVKIYFMSIAIAEQHRRWGEGIWQQAYIQLLNGFVDKLIYYAQNHGVRATHFVAATWKPEGRRMCEFFPMREIGKDRFGHSVFELDLEAAQAAPPPNLLPAFKRLLQIYRQLAP